MKILIFGSTGTIGRQLVAQGLEQGHTVTAFARNPAKLQDLAHPNLQVIEGDVLDAATVARAVKGQEAVFCALGAGSKGGVRAPGTANIIRALKQAGIRRFICQTTLGAGESRQNLNFFWKYLMFGLLLKKAYLDHEAQEQHIMQSGLDWTIVRPGAFTDGPLSSQYRHGFAANDTSIKLKISRADVADFMLKQLSDGAYLRKSPGLSY